MIGIVGKRARHGERAAAHGDLAVVGEVARRAVIAGVVKRQHALRRVMREVAQSVVTELIDDAGAGRPDLDVGGIAHDVRIAKAQHRG